MGSMSEKDIRSVAFRAMDFYDRNKFPNILTRVKKALRDNFPNIEQQSTGDIDEMVQKVMQYIREGKYKQELENPREGGHRDVGHKSMFERRKTPVEEAREMAAGRGDDELEDPPYEGGEKWWGNLAGYKEGMRK